MIRIRIGRLGGALLAAGLLACAPAEREAPGGGTPAESPLPPPSSAPAPPAVAPATAADSVPGGPLRDSVRAGPIFEVPAVDDGAGLPPDTAGAGASAPERSIAFTFDDLPVASAGDDLARQRAITAALLAAIAREAIPAIGFVNEGKLSPRGEVEPERVELLRRWLDAGLELGNHTHSHPDLHAVGRDAYEADVLRGEVVTRGLAERAGRPLRFFRHPFLRTGRDLETRRLFESFLEERGYRVAPVTVDNYDYLFAAAYERAGAEGAEARRVEAAYLEYMEAVVRYYEDQSRALFGREIPHVLLLHASALNAAALPELASMLRGRGYRFEPLEAVLTDPAYSSEDSYVGPAGITWLHRWALSQGKRGAFFAGEPEVPAWIEEAAREPAPAAYRGAGGAGASPPGTSISTLGTSTSGISTEAGSPRVRT